MLALASCKEEDSSSVKKEKTHEEELQHWQSIAESELAARQVAESEKLSSVSRADTLENAVIATGIAAVAFLFIGGAMGSRARKDVHNP